MSWKQGWRNLGPAPNIVSVSWKQACSWSCDQSWSWSWDSWSGYHREYIGEDPVVGVLVDWQQRGGNSFGWISPLYGLPKQLPESEYHGGDIYVHCNDIPDPRLGAICVFTLYRDKHGLGAEGCTNRQALRFAVPGDGLKARTLPAGESNPCSKYLKSLVFYPEFEKRDVTLCKYLLESQLQVFEMWGTPESIVAASEDIGLFSHPDASALVSKTMVRDQPSKNVKRIPVEVLPHVPNDVRIAVELGGDSDAAKERVVQLLGAWSKLYCVR